MQMYWIGWDDLSEAGPFAVAIFLGVPRGKFWETCQSSVKPALSSAHILHISHTAWDHTQTLRITNTKIKTSEVRGEKGYREGWWSFSSKCFMSLSLEEWNTQSIQIYIGLFPQTLLLSSTVLGYGSIRNTNKGFFKQYLLWFAKTCFLVFEFQSVKPFQLGMDEFLLILRINRNFRHSHKLNRKKTPKRNKRKKR